MAAFKSGLAVLTVFLYSRFYVLFRLLHGGVITINQCVYSSSKFQKMKIFKNLQASIAGKDCLPGELNRIAENLSLLQFREAGMISFALRFPDIFIRYMENNKESLSILPESCYFFANTAGSRLAIAGSLFYLLRNGQSGIAFIDTTNFPMFSEYPTRYFSEFEIKQEKSMWTVSLIQPYHPKSCIYLIDPSISGNLFKTLRLIREKHCSLFIIAETPDEKTKTLPVHFLGRRLLLPENLLKWSRNFQNSFFYLADSSKSLLFPKITLLFQQTGILQPNHLQTVFNQLARFAFIHPYLYTPFSFSSVWLDLKPISEPKAFIVSEIHSGKNRLVLFSNGKIFHYQYASSNNIPQGVKTHG